MIIHLSDRTPIEINEDHWKRESHESAIIDEGVVAYMSVIKSPYKYIVFAGAHSTAEQSDIVFEGGYMLDRSEDNLETKIYRRLDSLRFDMSGKVRQRIGIEGDPDRIYNVSVSIDNLFTATMRGMPPEPL